MSRLKNSLLKQLENDTFFADHYWQIENQQNEPELPNSNDRELSQSDLNLIKPTHWNHGKTNENPPF